MSKNNDEFNQMLSIIQSAFLTETSYQKIYGESSKLLDDLRVLIPEMETAVKATCDNINNHVASKFTHDNPFTVKAGDYEFDFPGSEEGYMTFSHLVEGRELYSRKELHEHSVPNPSFVELRIRELGSDAALPKNQFVSTVPVAGVGLLGNGIMLATQFADLDDVPGTHTVFNEVQVGVLGNFLPGSEDSEPDVQLLNFNMDYIKFSIADTDLIIHYEDRQIATLDLGTHSKDAVAELEETGSLVNTINVILRERTSVMDAIDVALSEARSKVMKEPA